MADHPFVPDWNKEQAQFVAKHEKKGAKDFILGPWEKETGDVDKALRALDKAISSGDRDKSEKAFLAFLKAKRTHKKKVIEAAKKDPNADGFKNDLKALLAYLDEIEGSAEMNMPKAAATTKPTFLKDWKFSKKKFEAATGKKKPSATLLKVFRSSSGIEKALKEVESALVKADKPKYVKARKSFNAAMDAYLKEIGKATQKEGADEDYVTELGDLRLRLQMLESDIVNSGSGL